MVRFVSSLLSILWYRSLNSSVVNLSMEEEKQDFMQVTYFACLCLFGLNLYALF